MSLNTDGSLKVVADLEFAWNTECIVPGCTNFVSTGKRTGTPVDYSNPGLGTTWVDNPGPVAHVCVAHDVAEVQAAYAAYKAGQS